jgi:hypothetical protein
LRPGCPCKRICSPIMSMCNTLVNSGIFIPRLPASPVNQGTWYICRYRVSIFGGLLGSNFPSNTCRIAVSRYSGITCVCKGNCRVRSGSKLKI